MVDRTLSEIALEGSGSATRLTVVHRDTDNLALSRASNPFLDKTCCSTGFSSVLSTVKEFPGNMSTYRISLIIAPP